MECGDLDGRSDSVFVDPGYACRVERDSGEWYWPRCLCWERMSHILCGGFIEFCALVGASGRPIFVFVCRFLPCRVCRGQGGRRTVPVRYCEAECIQRRFLCPGVCRMTR